MRYKEIALKALFVSPLNTRKDLQAGQEDSAIEDLASDIRNHGLLNPLLVRPVSDGKYEVISGQRRLRACKQIGLDPVPCLVRENVDDADAMVLSLVENVHRADMNPLDKARAIKALYDRYASYDRVAKETAWSVNTVRRYIRLLDLPEELQQRISTTEGPAGVSALAKLATSFPGEEATEVYDKISGFTQPIQEEILKRSGGDIGRINDLVDQAVAGVFDKRFCGGAFRCEIIRDILEGNIKQSTFQEVVKDVAHNLQSNLGKSHLDRASGQFWKALARKKRQ